MASLEIRKPYRSLANRVCSILRLLNILRVGAVVEDTLGTLIQECVILAEATEVLRAVTSVEIDILQAWISASYLTHQKKCEPSSALSASTPLRTRIASAGVKVGGGDGRDGADAESKNEGGAHDECKSRTK